MRYVDEFRERRHIMHLADLVKKTARGKYTFMEVCGGHTAAIHRFGIPSLLPSGIRLISGPGCPVCVTATECIDTLIALALTRKVTIATFGDLMRVPGSVMSLAAAAGEGADVRIVLSAFDALELARLHPELKVVFPAIGFETTAPGTAVTVTEAHRAGDRNFFILSAHKVMPPAMEELMKDGARLDGFLCPGHVSVITGSAAFEFIPEKHGLGCVITGFEPTDILTAILMLVRQVNGRHPEVQIQYNRAVTREGNTKAQKYMNEVFEPCDAEWRGLGTIKSGGLRLRDRYRMFDAAEVFDAEVPQYERRSACICGDILRGVSTPDDCPLFAKACDPDHPEGACMVSDEGACNTFYRYHIHE
jgi:hydrogenase expression/formation protein HypD